MLSFASQLLAFFALWAILVVKYAGNMPGPFWLYFLLAPWVAALIVATVAAVWQIVYYRFIHPLATFPGPFWAGVTRLWLARINTKGREHEELLKLHRIHGPVVRISPTLLSISEASMLPLIYHREADKTEHYTAFVKGGPESFFNIANHKDYVKARKVVGKPFSASSVKKLEPFVNDHIERWLGRIDELYVQDSRAFDFAPWATYLGFDVITDLAFGTPMGFIDTASDVGNLIKGLHTGWLLFGLMSRLHPMKSYMSRSWAMKKLFSMKPNDKSGFGVLMKSRDRIIEERLEARAVGREVRPDVLQGLLDARDDKGRPMDMETIRQEVLVILIAGADTVGTTLQGVLHDLLDHPHALERCTLEITSAHGRGLISTPPTVAEVHEHCPFFAACLRETLRVNPSGPGIFPRLVSRPGVELAGRFVPAGTEVAANIWVVARDKKLYGEDAEEWRPERWLDQDEGRLRVMNRMSMSWGVDRACLGKEVALMELCKAGVELLRRYKVRRANGGGESERWVVKAGVGWWEGVLVELQRR